MDDDMEIERMLEEKMQEDVQKQEKEPIINKNGEKKEKEKDKDKDKDKDKKHKKHHKHHKHKSHKSEKKHDRKRSRSPRRSRSPTDRRRSPTPPTLPSGKRRDVNSELHQLAKTLSRQTHQKESASASKLNRREKSPELTPEERDLRTVFCKKNFLWIEKKNIYCLFRYAISSNDSSTRSRRIIFSCW